MISTLNLRFYALCFALFMAGFSINSANAVSPDFKTGYVLARSVVLDPDTGEPILVEFGTDGKEVSPVDTQGQKTSDLIIYPAADYRFQSTRLTEFKEQYKDTLAKDAELMSRKQFEQASFMYADNQTGIQQEELKEGFHSVLVRAQNNRFAPIDGASQDANEVLVLLSFDIDLTQSVEVNEQAQSLVLNRDGQVVTQSANTIGYRVGFFGDPNSPDQPRGGRIGSDDTVYGPIAGVNVNVEELVYPGGRSVTDSDGRYNFRFNLPTCPLGGFSFTTDVWAELKYKNFLPTGSPSIPYFLRTPGYSYCFPLLGTFFGSSITSSSFGGQSNLYADVMFLSGRMTLKNAQGEAIEVGDTTYTTFEKPAKYTTQQFYDFNGDGESDHVEQGRVLTCQNVDDATDEKSVFLSDKINSSPLTGSADEVIADYTCQETDANPEPDQGGNWQGIFFDGQQDDADDYPDLVRVIDREFRDEEIGVLKRISQADMRNTDVYLFRESTGQLILERRGLKPAEANYRRSVEYDEDENEVAFRIMLRGNRDTSLNIGGGVQRSQSFEDWATDYQLSKPFQQRNADHPRPGEFIKVVAINRATGYTGTSRVQLKLRQTGNGTIQNSFDVEVPDITLTPPNLKIWAERDYTVEQGLTKGEDRTFTIGNEGAALTNDTAIKLFTEWLDEDGKPLPDELGLDNGEQYGLTGRFAKVVGQNQLKGDSVNSDLAEFAIAPGRNTQALRLKGQSNGTEHFYIHVIGKAKEQECVSTSSCPSFDTSSQQSGLEGRPKLLTPFLTPLWDEDKSWQEFRAYRNRVDELEGGLAEGEELPETDKPQKPLPAYAWQYRPEYQFSQFELEIAALEDSQKTNILGLDSPVLNQNEDFVVALYSLIENEFSKLSSFDSDNEFILSLGGYEQRVTFGTDQSVRFSNLGSISSVDADDFIALRLYSNSDAQNILWEYAFAGAQMFPARVTNASQSENTLEISADALVGADPAVALFVGSEDLSQSVSWRLEGNGSLEKNTETSNDGNFSTSFMIPPKAGNIATIIAKLGSQAQEFISPSYEVIPGLPAEINQLTKNGSTVIGTLGEVEVVLEIKDQFGNLVDDGVDVLIDAPELNIVEQTSSLDGQVTIKFSGDEKAGNLPVKYSIGNALLEDSIFVHDVELSFINGFNVNTNSTIPVSLKATSDYGDLEGLEIDLVVLRGKLSGNRFALDSSGMINTNYNSGAFRGYAQMSAKVAGTTQVLTESFNVNEVDDYLTSNVLVTGGDGGIEFSSDSGTAVLNYSSTSELVVNSSPGSVIKSNLDDIFNPPVYAVLDYNQDFPRTSQNKLLDLSSGLDADLESVVFQSSRGGQSAFSLKFDGTSKLKTDSHLRTRQISEGGINFAFKAESISQIVGPKTFLNWNDFGLSLEINSEGKLIVRTTSSGNEVVLESPSPLENNQWSNIAIHFYQNELRLGIDNKETSIALSSIDKAETDVGLLIEAITGSSFSIANLKIYDWAGESKVNFADGSFQTTGITSEEGIAKIAFSAQAPTIAYSRAHRKVEPLFVQFASELLISNAHAQTSSTETRALKMCSEQFIEVTDAAIDPVLANAERFMNIVLECFIKREIDQVQIKYEKENNFFSKGALLVQRGVYEGTYSALKKMKGASVLALNCIDAVITGKNASATGITCDIISGFFAIGDIRDLLIQGFHFFVGDPLLGNKNYDPMMAGLASIGLVADLATVSGVGTIPGAILNGLAAVAKPVAKAFRTLGKPGMRAAKIFGKEFERVASLDVGIAVKADKLKKFVPLIEIFSAALFIRASNPAAFELLTKMVTSADTLTKLGRWFVRHTEKLAQEVSTIANNFEKAFKFLIPDAFAVSKPVADIIVKQLIEIVEIGNKLAVKNSDELAEHYNEAITQLLKLIDEGGDQAAKLLGTGAKESNIIEAFIIASAMGGKDAAKSLSKINGVNGLGLGKNFNQAKMIESVGLLKDINFLGTLSKVDRDKMFASLFKKMGSDTFRIAKGANHQLLTTIDFLKRNPNAKFIGLEIPVDIVFKGVKYGRRDYDVVFELNGKLVRVEAKAWTRGYLDEGLKRSLSFSGKLRKDGTDPAGQLLKDFAGFASSGSKNFETKWFFSPEVIADLGIDLTEANIKNARKEIADKIGDLMVDNPTIKKNTQQALGLKGISDADWDDFLFEGIGGGKAFLDKIKDELINIDNYSKILETVKI